MIYLGNDTSTIFVLVWSNQPCRSSWRYYPKYVCRLYQWNAVHGIDSDENAAIEGAFHFSGREMF